MADNTDTLSRLPTALLPWYRQNRRELPWRANREPYHIWLSEIMLQQTRVEAVKGYYARFLAALPTIPALAACDDETLHKLWEGLGYYSRVRNLKKAAQTVVADYAGVFPREYAQVLALPGIGAYTAGAICSIAYDQPTPAVDGNVLRLFARLTDDSTPVDAPVFKARTTQALAAVYPPQAGEFTQALMELGATLCGPNRKPACPSCPCRDFCLGHLHGTAETLPLRAPKREKRKERRTVFIFRCGNCYALEKRPDRGLLAGLWQFPNVEGHLDTAQVLDAARAMGLRPTALRWELLRRHVFTHIQWDMKGVYLEVAETEGSFQWFTEEQVNTQAALPTAFRLFWEEREHV